MFKILPFFTDLFAGCFLCAFVWHSGSWSKGFVCSKSTPPNKCNFSPETALGRRPRDLTLSHSHAQLLTALYTKLSVILTFWCSCILGIFCELTHAQLSWTLLIDVIAHLEGFFHYLTPGPIHFFIVLFSSISTTITGTTMVHLLLYDLVFDTLHCIWLPSCHLKLSVPVLLVLGLRFIKSTLVAGTGTRKDWRNGQL